MDGDKTHYLAPLVKAHASGDDDAFRALAMQAAARAARQGDPQTAREVKDCLDLCPPVVPRETSLRAPGEEPPLGGVYPSTRLKDLFISDDAARCVRTVVEEHRQRSLLLDNGLTPSSRVLFTGPFGNGETQAAAAVAGELGLPLFTADLGLKAHDAELVAPLLESVTDTSQRTRGVFLLGNVDPCEHLHDQGCQVSSFLEQVKGSPSVFILTARGASFRYSRMFDRVGVFRYPDHDQVCEVIASRLGTLVDRKVLREASGFFRHLTCTEVVCIAERAARSAVLRGGTVSVADLDDASSGYRADELAL